MMFFTGLWAGALLFSTSPCFAASETLKTDRLRIDTETTNRSTGTSKQRDTFPTILSINPSAVVQGQQALVSISGRNLKSNMAIRFGDGISTENLLITGDTQATVQLNVSTDAAPGNRVLQIVYRDQIKSSNVSLTVNQPYLSPVIYSVAPNVLTQGGSYQVILSGSNLGRVKTVDFGGGIKVKDISVPTRSQNTMTCTIDVAASSSPGARVVKAVDAKGSHPGRATVTVLAAAALPGTEQKQPTETDVMPDISQKTSAGSVAPVATFQLMGMTPNRWYAGRTYDVSIFGSDFEEDMQLSLGEDITIQNVDVKAAGYTTMTIRVDRTATGRKSLKMRSSALHAWTDTDIRGYVIPSVSGTPELTAGIQYAALEETETSEGVIDLKTPEFGDQWLMENAWLDTGVPTSDDSNEFTWEETPNGASQWYELRILDKDNTVLVQRKIEGEPLPDAFYVPDVAFLTEMFEAVRPDAAESEEIQTTVTGTVDTESETSGASSGASSSGPSSAEAYIAAHEDEIDCYWQVAGFKRFLSYQYVSQTGKYQLIANDVEIAVSERWPLKLPAYSPTGLICSNANDVTQLTVLPVTENIGEAVEGDNIFVGDTIRLSGKFTLEGCPWSVSYETDFGDPNITHVQNDSNSYGEAFDMYFYPVEGWALHNVFIDWGDGKFDRVYAIPTEEINDLETLGSAGVPPADVSPRGNLMLAITHEYRYPQKFPVRLFVLPEEEAGTIYSIVKANKAPEGGSVYQASAQDTAPFGGGTLLASLSITASDASVQGLHQASSSLSFSEDNYNFPEFEVPGGNAFLLYCEPKVIDVQSDPAATGDLHLIRLSIDGFSGQEAQSDAAIDVSGPVNSKSQEKIELPANGRQNTPLSQVSENGSQMSGIVTATEASNNLLTTAEASNDLLDQLQEASDAVAFTCDVGLYATAELEYFGLGRIHLVWKVDNVEIARTLEDVGPSPIRTELDEEGNYTEPEKHGYLTFTSPNLPLNSTGLHGLTVEASVEGYEGVEWQPGTEGGQKGGVYVPGLPASPEYYKYVSRTAFPKTYRVNASDPDQPCAFYFPVADGKYFVVSNLQGRVTQENGRYSGEGTLYFSLPDGPSSLMDYSVDIHIANWEVDDRFMVTQGAIHEININKTIDSLPAVSALLKRLNGEAGKPLTATMDITIKDSGLHRVGAIEPPEWLNTEAYLIPGDGWYAEGQALPETEIYWSDFRISSNDVALDLSWTRGGRPAAESIDISGAYTDSNATVTINSGGTQIDLPQSGASTSGTTPKTLHTTPKTLQLSQSGDAMASLQNSDDSSYTVRTIPWAGVNLGQTARIYPYLFNLADLDAPARGWGITDSGIQGQATFNHFEYVLGDGSISFDGIDIVSDNHHLEASYEGVEIHIPWPDVILEGGDASVSYTQGEDTANIAFHFQVPGQVIETYQNAIMTVSIKDFEKRGSGWGILTDTTFDFSDGRNDFAAVELTDLFFNVFGEAHFTGTGDQAYNRHISLNNITTFGETAFTLSGLDLHATADFLEEERLSFEFNGQINFDQTLSADDVRVFYKINKPPGQDFQATGPGHSQIKVCSDFYPGGEPLSRIEVYPELDLSGSSGISYEAGNDDSLISWLVPSAYAAMGVEDTFRGEVNAEMFGIDLPGVTAEFRYGKYNNRTYWLTHLSGSGVDIPIFTSGVNLKSVEGGIAHGFDQHVFKGSPMSAIPSGSDTFYSAGITIGSPDPADIYRLKGILTVGLSDALIRMDFNQVRLLGFNLKNSGGHFTYQNSEFTGGVYGGFSLYDDVLKCEIPDDYRCGLYFSPTEWEIHAGTKNSPIEMIFFNRAGVGGYYQLGNLVGYQVGGRLGFDTDKQCVLKVFAARAYADAQVSVGIAPTHLDGHFSMSAGLHAYIPCSGGWDDSFHKSIDVDVSAPPLKMSSSISFKAPKLLGGKKYTFRFGI